jgi:hypothetical protein
MEQLPPDLERKRHALERYLNRPVSIRGVRLPDRAFRGRLRVGPSRVVIEYQVAQSGYFWHIPIIEELLNRAAAGECAVELREVPAEREAEPPAR